MPREEAIDKLYLQIIPLEKDLMNDNVALKWFDYKPKPEPTAMPSTPPPSAYPSDASTGAIPNFLTANKPLEMTFADLLVDSMSLPPTPLTSTSIPLPPNGAIA
jgi:hypothetical protein